MNLCVCVQKQTLISCHSSIMGPRRKKRQKKKKKTFPVCQKQSPMLPPPTHPRNTLLPHPLRPCSCENSEHRRRRAEAGPFFCFVFLTFGTVQRMFDLIVCHLPSCSMKRRGSLRGSDGEPPTVQDCCRIVSPTPSSTILMLRVLTPDSPVEFNLSNRGWTH